MHRLTTPKSMTTGGIAVNDPSCSPYSTVDGYTAEVYVTDVPSCRR